MQDHCKTCARRKNCHHAFDFVWWYRQYTAIDEQLAMKQERCREYTHYMFAADLDPAAGPALAGQ
jgi:hypothetical protein